MKIIDCRKLVKDGDTLKIRCFTGTGLTVTLTIYDPSMASTSVSMTENPSGSGIYEYSYTFPSATGDYLFVADDGTNKDVIQVSVINELAFIDAAISSRADQTTVDGIKVDTDLIPNIKANTDLTPYIKEKTDKLLFDDDSFVKATIDDSNIAKESSMKRMRTEMDRARLWSRRNAK